MSQQGNQRNSALTNPLFWVSLLVVGLIVFIFVVADRGGVKVETLETDASSRIPVVKPQGQIEREPIVEPGKRARQFISEFKAQGQPYPLEEVMAQASVYAAEGSLADAHIAFFFAAREGHIEAMMTMAEMSDPTLFRAENNLLDRADPIQAYKWYKRALDKGFEPARGRLNNLHQWAKAEANYGNPSAYQLLLNFN
jgi:hypothetical protein